MKKRAGRGDPRRRGYWEELLRRWREGGQGVRAFCRAEGVRESAFYFWRRKLVPEERHSQQQAPAVLNDLASAAATRRRVKRVPKREAPLPSFLPVQLVESHAAAGVEIALERGRTLRVPVGFDRQTLADVLAVLEGRPC